MATQAIDRKQAKHQLRTVKRVAPQLVNRSNKRTFVILGGRGKGAAANLTRRHIANAYYARMNKYLDAQGCPTPFDWDLS